MGARRVSAYFSVNRWLGRGPRLVRPWAAGVWLGLLSDSDLDAIDERFHVDRPPYLDEGYNESGLFPWERHAVEEYFSGGSRVAVTAAGGGREVLALRRLGFEALGFESHPALAGAARGLLAAKGWREAVARCERDVWPTGERFDAAVVGWGSYTLIRSREERIAFLRGATRSLPVGAPILLSFFGCETHGFGPRVTAALANAVRAARGRERVRLGDSLVPQFAHVFTQAEVTRELREGGFDVVDYRPVPFPHVIAERR